MATSTPLRESLLQALRGHRTSAPVFSVRQRSVEELESEAAALAGRFHAPDLEADATARVRVERRSTASLLRVPGGARAIVHHASGAIHVRRAMGTFENTFVGEHTREALVKRAVATVSRLGLDRLPGHESLTFERLWQVKASGMAPSGERGQTVLCRAVGAFRRHLQELPVYGRASVFVKLAGRDAVEAAGVDWRLVVPAPFDHVPILDPEEAVDRVLAELARYQSGGEGHAQHYELQLFALGYFALPKRATQEFFQPVFVALLRATGWSTLNRLIVVPASNRTHESFTRTVAKPPLSPAKPPRTSKPWRGTDLRRRGLLLEDKS